MKKDSLSKVIKTKEQANKFMDELNRLTTPHMTLWRTLIRIESFDKEKIEFVVPSWDHTQTVTLDRKNLPDMVNEVLDNKVELPYRLFAKCNIDNENKNELIFAEWEIKK